MMDRVVTVALLAGLLCIIAVALWPDPSSAQSSACGEDGQPPCPLQAWMERNMQPPTENQDLPALQRALEQSADMAPDPSWNRGSKAWNKIARDGAAAAAAGDFAGARQSCKGCHQAWRDQYKRDHRTRPVR